jgi:FkbM family methyltransferase
MMKTLVHTFIKIHYWLNFIGIKIPGLGYVQKYLKKEFVFRFLGSNLLFFPSIEGSYDYLLIGKSNEPETHAFLNNVLPALNSANFIDVGASVGEFVMSACKHANVQKVFAFEPRPECSFVLWKNAELNDEKRLVVFENAVSNAESDIVFHRNPGGTSSGMYNHSTSGRVITLNVKAVTLDSVLPEKLENAVILIDVEGAEPLVLKGGNTFIENNKPLIIFEYNNTSKQHFHLSEIKEILGKEYDILRLKSDGNLDKDFSNSWNCVAMPLNTVFSKILLNSIKLGS